MSIFAFWERVLPKYVNLSTALSVSPLTLISGSMYGLPGAGWNRTSVFLMLIVSPKLSQDLENKSS